MSIETNFNNSKDHNRVSNMGHSQEDGAKYKD